MSDSLRVPFIFVKHGDPPPLDWMARHPDWVKIPAVMIRRDSPDHPANGGRYPTFPLPAASPVAAARREAPDLPLTRPLALGAPGSMSRLSPGNPPRYPTGHAAPPGSGLASDDPVAIYVRASRAFTPRNLARFAGHLARVVNKPRKSTAEEMDGD